MITPVIASKGFGLWNSKQRAAMWTFLCAARKQMTSALEESQRLSHRYTHLHVFTISLQKFCLCSKLLGKSIVYFQCLSEISN